MTWREELRPASFKGVPFAVESASGEFGRRVQVHEFPQRDLPYAEDLGRKSRWSLPATSGNDEDATGSLLRLGTLGPELPAVSETTPPRRQQAANRRAIADLVRRAAAIESARLSARLRPATAVLLERTRFGG